MIFITRKEHFNAAHRLFNPAWNDQQNMDVFGKCSNPNWHGHNYTLYVTVKGIPNPDTGFVMNLKTLSAIINEKILDKVDHKNLNLDVDFMHGIQPSAENIAIAFWNEIVQPINNEGAELHCVRVVETENNQVEYFGK